MLRWFDRFRRLPSEEEFAQELQSHLAHVVDEEVERGSEPQAARYAALRKFGNVTRHVERFREASPAFWLETLAQDVRDGWRSLWRTPGLTSILILSLALGVGANAAVLLATRTLLFHPMPVPDPHRVFFIGDVDLKEPLPYGYREQLATVFEPLGDIGNLLQDTVVVRLGAERLLESAVWASEGALRALGFAPQVGRWPSRTEHDTGAPVVVLSDRFWRERFAARSDAIGQEVWIQETPLTVIGVAPRNFRGLMPTLSPAVILSASTFSNLRIVGPFAPSEMLPTIVRLRPGISRTMAEAQLATWRLEAVPDAQKNVHFGERVPKPRLFAPREWLLEPDSRNQLSRALVGTAGVAGLVLLLGCTNLIAAMLARSEARRREAAMRLALGAGQWRLLRSLGAEFLILGVLSGGGGLLASVLIVASLRPALNSHFAVLSTFPLELIDVVWRQDSTTIALALVAGVGACALCGLVPTLRLLTQDPLRALRLTGPTHTRTSVGRSVALSLQVAACCVLLVGALLFIRSVQRGLSVDLGYAGRHLLMTWVDMPWPKYNRAECTRLRNQITSRLAEHPDVVGAAFGTSLSPFAENQWTWAQTREVAIDDVVRLPPQTILLEDVDPAYRSVIGLPLLAGRDISAADARGAERVALINATMARTLWPAGNALGSRVRVRLGVKLWAPRTGNARIVGIVGDARVDLRRGAVPAIYMPRVQSDHNGAGGGLLYVRTRGTPAAIAAWVRNVKRQAVPDQPVRVVQSVGDRIEMLLAPERIARDLLWWFAAVALVLSGLGVYGLAAHDVARRSREIAIRLALGARPGAIRKLVARVAVLPVIVGIAVGLLTLAVLVPALKAFLFETTPFDPSCWVGAAALLSALGAGAVWWPSRMALRVDPSVTLRAE